jgi:hypothetical protein
MVSDNGGILEKQWGDNGTTTVDQQRNNGRIMQRLWWDNGLWTNNDGIMVA